MKLKQLCHLVEKGGNFAVFHGGRMRRDR
jgi:hypothetical protein